QLGGVPGGRKEEEEEVRLAYHPGQLVSVASGDAAKDQSGGGGGRPHVSARGDPAGAWGFVCRGDEHSLSDGIEFDWGRLAEGVDVGGRVGAGVWRGKYPWETRRRSSAPLEFTQGSADRLPKAQAALSPNRHACQVANPLARDSPEETYELEVCLT